MECIVTGCIDCPLFDKTGSEYGTYCHHPKRVFEVEVSVMADEKKDGSRIKSILVLDSEKEYYVKELRRQNLLSREDEKKEPWMSIHIINEPIEDDEKYNPITPDWCPLKKESITISLNK